MKTRTGFVSNSSTTSFALYGYYFSASDEVIMEKLSEKFGMNISILEHDLYEVLHVIQSQFQDMKVIVDYSNKLFYIGKSYHEDMKNTETKQHFMDSIQKKIQKVFGRDARCDYYMDTIER